MHCGKNAREAVQIAIDLDCYSGGRVDSFAIDQSPHPAFIVVEK